MRGGTAAGMSPCFTGCNSYDVDSFGLYLTDVDEPS